MDSSNDQSRHVRSATGDINATAAKQRARSVLPALRRDYAAFDTPGPSYGDVIADLAIWLSVAVRTLTVAPTSESSPCRFAIQVGSL
jgi:hypothetical protein